jgi:hypothetical protein
VGLEYINKHAALLDYSAVFAASNRSRWERCVKAALENGSKQQLEPVTAALRATLQRHLHETNDAKAACELLKSQTNWAWLAESLPRLLELKREAAVSLAVAAYPALQPWKAIEILSSVEAAVRECERGWIPLFLLTCRQISHWVDVFDGGCSWQ